MMCTTKKNDCVSLGDNSNFLQSCLAHATFIVINLLSRILTCCFHCCLADDDDVVNGSNPFVFSYMHCTMSVSYAITLFDTGTGNRTDTEHITFGKSPPNSGERKKTSK